MSIAGTEIVRSAQDHASDAEDEADRTIIVSGHNKDEKLTESTVDQMKLKQLKEELQKLVSLETKGKKTELKERLKNHLQEKQKNQDSETEESGEEEEEVSEDEEDEDSEEENRKPSKK